MSLHQTVLDPDNVSDTLKCPVCMEVFNDPVFCGGRPCQHVFCRECVERALERSEQCPVCRETMLSEDLHPHQVIRSLLDEVIVICQRECGWTGRRDALSSHQAVCPVVLMEQAQECLEAQSRRFAGVDKQLTEKDARIAELERLVEEKDRLVISTGQEVVNRQLQIAELENRCKKTTQQLLNCRQQLAERSAELDRLRELREEGGLRLPLSPPTSYPARAAPPPTPLHRGCLVDATLEAAASALDPNVAAGTLVEMTEDAWQDPLGFSQMHLTSHEDAYSHPSPHASNLDCPVDDTGGEPWL